MHGHKVFCMMNSGGKPMTKQLADALLFNAYDMFQEGTKTQRIKARKYDGVIESTLEVLDFNGVPSVSFEANISTDKWESNTISFIIRVDDLDGLEKSEWCELQVKVMGFGDLPEELKEMIRSQGGGPESDNGAPQFSEN